MRKPPGILNPANRSNPFQAVGFDFDGVILESAGIKVEGFVELYADVPEHADWIRAFCEVRGGMPRFEKFRHIHQYCFNREPDEAESISLGKRFSNIVLSKVLACPFVPGAMEFLKKHHPGLPLFVISGTPTGELNRVAGKRDVLPYLTACHGSPTPKGEWIREILGNLDIIPENFLFVGDAPADHVAAMETGVPFVVREHPGNASFVSELTGVYRVDDIKGLSALPFVF